jgi:hypothetical protein
MSIIQHLGPVGQYVLYFGPYDPPGDTISVTRRQQNSRWQWGEEREKLTLKRETTHSASVAKP